MRKDSLPAFPIAAPELVPQSGAMLLIDELTRWQPGRARSRLVVGSGRDGARLFLDPAGTLDAAAQVEMLAQLVAARRGLEQKLKGKEPNIGFLVGLKSVVLSGRARKGDEIALECEESLALEGVSVEKARMLRGEEVLAQGDVKVWEQPDALPAQAPGAAPCGVAAEPAQAPCAVPTLQNGLGDRSPMSLSLLERCKELERPSPGTIEGEFLFDAAFPGFDGHFPGFPILPAVVMIQAGATLCELAARRRLRLVEIPQAKFSKRVGPGETLRVRAALDPPAFDRAGPFAARIRLTRGREPVAQYACRLEEN